MFRSSSNGPRLRFFTAEDALDLDHATSAARTANLLPTQLLATPFLRSTRQRRRRPSIVNSLLNDEFDSPRAVIKLESLGQKGGRLICLIQLVAFLTSIALISMSTYMAEQSVLIDADRVGDNCSSSFYPSSSTSTDPPILSSCTTTEINSPLSSKTTFSSTMSNLGSILGRIDLQIVFPNGTDYGIDNSTSYVSEGSGTIMLPYDLELFGCGKAPSTSCTGDDWLKVLVLTSERSLIDFAEDSFGPRNYRARLFSIFQNQENIINHGWVSSYKLQVALYNNTKLLSPETSQMYFDFGYDDIQTLPVEKSFRFMFFIFNLAVLVYWLMKNFTPSTHTNFKTWVEEKKWITFLLIGTVFFQNPVLIVAQFTESPSIDLAVATKCSQIFSSALLGWVFLLFSDGMAFHSKTPFQFYFPKTLLMLLYLCASLVFELLSTPIFVNTKYRSPLLSTYNWSDEMKLVDLYLGAFLLILSLLMGISFILNMHRTIRTLNNLPYLEFRYQHLSYRFYFFHSLSIFFYSIASYGLTLWRVFLDISESASNICSVNFEEEFNILLRTTTSNFGQQLFVAFYAYVFAYMFLPPSRSSFMQSLLLQSFTKCEDPSPSHSIFCLETACWLLECAWQSYYDIPGSETIGGWGSMDVEQHNLSLIAQIHNDKNETHVILLKDKRRNRIVICFRGTSCEKHWSTNLNYSMRKVDLDFLGLPESVQRLLSDSAESTTTSPPTPFNDPSIFRSSIDTETHLGFDDLKNTLLKPSVTPRPLNPPNMEELGEGLTNFLGSVEASVLTTLGGGVHGGFMDAYLSIRSELQQKIVSALLSNPADIYVTGHSLGGALANICAYDLASNVLPPLTSTLNEKWTAEIKEMGSDWIDYYSGRLKRAPRLSLYTFGSPRCFSRISSRRLNELVKSSFRVACDGDIVTSFPKYAGGRGSAYKHGGTCVVVDGSGKGRLIMSPSFVEKNFQMANRTKLKKHSLQCYRLGLWGAIGQSMDEREQAISQSGLNREDTVKFLSLDTVNDGMDEDEVRDEDEGGRQGAATSTHSSFMAMEEFVDANERTPSDASGGSALRDIV